MRTKRTSWWLIALLILFPSCSTVKTPFKPETGTVLIEKVPFYPQKEYQCGPASLAGVLNFWKVSKTPSDIAKDIFIPSAKGTLTIDMVLKARDYGLDAIQYSGGLKDLKLKIRDGYPLIVLVDYGFWRYQINHFMVVIGYNDNGVFANSGESEKVFIKNDDFLKLWEKTEYWTLWIKPKSS